jgi:hypothetical protein
MQPRMHQEQQMQQQEQEQEQEETPKQIVYASQHYTHSYHVPTRSSSEPALKTHIDSSDLAAVLLRNSIDPTLLFPSQIELFQNADDDQRLRLLELWRISPPSGRQGHPAGVDYNMSRQLYDWPPTSLAQEEAMAKLRYEKQQAESAQQEAIQQHQQQLEQSMSAGWGRATRKRRPTRSTTLSHLTSNLNWPSPRLTASLKREPSYGGSSTNLRPLCCSPMT